MYYAECLRIMPENTAKLCSGSYITVKLNDILNPKIVETRTQKEIEKEIDEEFERLGFTPKIKQNEINS